MLALLLSPQGRISRSRFWLGILTIVILGIAASIWLEMSIFGRNPFDPAAQPLAKPAQQIEALLSLLFVYPNFVVTLKRFHDRNKSWLWALPLLALDLVFVAAQFFGVLGEVSPKPIMLGLLALGLAALLWVVIELGCLKGTTGSNSFGPDPLVPGVGQAKA